MNYWHPALRIGIGIVFVALFVLSVRLLWPFLSPLAVALLLTYMLVPVVSRIEQDTGWSRTAATLFVYILLLVGLALIPALVVPVVVEQVQAFIPTLQRAVDDFGQLVSDFGTLTLFGQPFDPYQIYLDFADQITQQLLSITGALASSSVSLIFGVASSVLSTLLWTLFVLVISLYLVRDSPNIARYFWGLIPREHRLEIYYLTRRIDRTWNAFLRGELILSSVIFVTTTLALLILGVPQALFLGILAGLFNLLPNIGPFISAVPAIVLALVQGSNYFEMSNLLFALVVAGAYTLIQQLESNLLVPRIIGGSVHLHPAVVLIGAIIGLQIAGILGVFLAAPTLASLRVIGGYAYRKMLDPNFAPEGVVLPDSITAIPDPRERQPVPIPTPTDEPAVAWRVRLIRLLHRGQSMIRRQK